MPHRLLTCCRSVAAVALVVSLPFISWAQTGSVGIGTTSPDASAALDIMSSSKGVLLPRVAAAVAITSPAPGLLVYQTGAPAGFYYNTGTAAAPSWQQIGTTTQGDNLGNHTATKALDLAGFQLVSGSSSGLAIGSTGAVSTANTLTTGGTITVPVASDYAYAAPRPLALLLGWADFQSVYGYVALFIRADNSFYPNGSSGASFQAPLHLPQGATITGITLVGTDGSATNDLSAALTSVPALTGGSRTTIASANTTGNSTALQTVTSAPVAVAVDNTTTSYSVAVTFQVGNNSMSLNCVRVNYTVSRTE